MSGVPFTIFTLRCVQIANKHLHSSRRELAVGTRTYVPDHTTNASSATEDAVSDEAAHRLVSMLTHPQPQRWVPYSRKCHRKPIMWGQPAVTPRRRLCRHRRRGRDHRENVLRPVDILAIRPTTSSLRGSGAEPAS